MWFWIYVCLYDIITSNVGSLEFHKDLKSQDVVLIFTYTHIFVEQRIAYSHCETHTDWNQVKDNISLLLKTKAVFIHYNVYDIRDSEKFLHSFCIPGFILSSFLPKHCWDADWMRSTTSKVVPFLSRLSEFAWSFDKAVYLYAGFVTSGNIRVYVVRVHKENTLNILRWWNVQPEEETEKYSRLSVNAIFISNVKKEYLAGANVDETDKHINSGKKSTKAYSMMMFILLITTCVYSATCVPVWSIGQDNNNKQYLISKTGKTALFWFFV